ncbi:hypothetical protein [Nitrososphaera viennensis]|uniref:Uncharacterized protein n=2 Tax=Nitrososphaera viennensis TaxID=1034015 RepID=A0A060HEY9_9ARCH|nr:hypothetical protein [Nitrososphaera viennensis]AIC14198.1 hypothetical protein NVIE_000160 [Nitrososphaera viennensis EN76]UVS69199.1 hypothetical protein NWT39_00065 [Nitrososphaera viennensis]
MRLPLKGTDYFSKQANAAFENIQAEFLEAVKPAIAMQKSHAMLGDGTVTQTDTFDPQNVQTFYQRLTNRMEGWLAGGISKSVTDDLHRLFCQFSRDVGNKYYISGYFGIQFHALPYYKADKRVIEVQKELAKIADDATALYGNIRDSADRALGQELEKRGLAEMDFEGLFSKMFEDEKLAEELDKKAASVEGQAEFQKMGERKNALFAELNDLMIELYQTSAVPIDYNRLMQGEEGVCTYFDIELIKGSKKAIKREAVFETGKIPKVDADKVAGELASVVKALKKAK